MVYVGGTRRREEREERGGGGGRRVWEGKGEGGEGGRGEGRANTSSGQAAFASLCALLNRSRTTSRSRLVAMTCHSADS